MKILALADEPEKKFWDGYAMDTLRQVDLILSCGDLPRAYLEFLVTMARCPLVYVHGNHDERYTREGQDFIPGHKLLVPVDKDKAIAATFTCDDLSGKALCKAAYDLTLW